MTELAVPLRFLIMRREAVEGYHYVGRLYTLSDMVYHRYNDCVLKISGGIYAVWINIRVPVRGLRFN